MSSSLLRNGIPRTALPALMLIVLVVVLGYEDLGLPLTIAIVVIALGLEALVLRDGARKGSVVTVDDVTLTLPGRFRRTDQQRRSAIFDETTNLYHRWYLELRLEEEAGRSRRYNYPISVLVIRTGQVDLGSFSLDGWREEAAETARLASGTVRDIDLPAALSPLEYAICLIHCDRNGAERVLERMLRALPGRDCEAGISVYPDDGCEPGALIDLAKGRLRQVEVRDRNFGEIPAA